MRLAQFSAVAVVQGLLQLKSHMAAPKMSTNKTLIAYETKSGVTEESARKIAEVLRSKYRLEVDLVDLKEQKVHDLTQYRNIVVGGGVRAGRVYGKALKFLENDLSGKQIAFFISSSMAGTPGSHDNAKARFVEKNLAKYPKINPVSTEAFGGRIRYLRKTMVDNTDLAKVEAWAEELGKKFTQ
jgi:menaquinone-dependent protoporphyrinogen oxidase